MGTKREGDSCYEKAGLDEPIFVLRAQDAHAPWLVLEWARRVEAEAISIGMLTAKIAAKTGEARVLAGRMFDWQKKNHRKSPD